MWNHIQFFSTSELCQEIGTLINLHILGLNYNQITELGLPKEIGNLINLLHLSISVNQITELPKEIGNLINLQELDISKNKRIPTLSILNGLF